MATELIRQGLRSTEITSLVALSRRPVQLDVNESNTSKFESVLVRDYAQYSDSAKAALAGADACIWYVISSGSRHISFVAPCTQLMQKPVKDCWNHAGPGQHLRLRRGQARVSGLHNFRTCSTERGELFHTEACQVCLFKWAWNFPGLQHKAFLTGRIPNHARRSNISIQSITDPCRVKLGVLTRIST